MTPLILVDVDTQHDFMDPTGALYVPGAERLVDNLAAIVAAARAHGVPHLATLDTHTPDDPEFAAYGFPAHCVAGTPGHAKLAVTEGARVFTKATFDVYTNPAFAEAVAALAPEAALVVGVATDYCVKAAALGLLKQGVPVLLVDDAIAPVAPETGAAALLELEAAGARRITTAEALALMAREVAHVA